MKIREILETIKNTAGTLDKKQILKDNMNDVLQMIFEDTYSDRKYHVKKYNVLYAGSYTLDEHYHVFRDMLDQLSERTVTGKAAIKLVEDTIGWYVPEDQWVLNGIIEKNLKVGISKDNFNDVTGNAIDKFEVALAYNLEKVKGVDVLDGTYLASRKCDGARCITIIDTIENTIVFKSRQGKEFKTLDNLKKPLLDVLSKCEPGKIVIDGEICIVDENGDEHFNWIMREITRKDHTIKNPHYKMFDILNYDQFMGKDISLSFSSRYAILKDIFEDCEWYSVLEQERITSQEDFDRWTQKATDGEWEGFMLRKDVPYESGRTKDLLKVKKFKTNDYYIKKILTGKATYNENGSKEYDVVSALVIEHRGNEVFVGSGISKEQRIDWYHNPEKIVGMCVRVKYFEETRDSKTGKLSLRFPVLDYIYGKKRFDEICDQYIE
jgi:DNA ligase-1